MVEWRLNTPVAFLIFNRPDTTARVFAEIAKARPPQLLIVADGPRPDQPGDAERCAATRAVAEQVDWDCQVLQNYADSNLGCKKRVSSGLDWVFQNVEEAIVLEDDVLPHPSFFRYCEELLERYRHDSRVMQICGLNVVHEQQKSPYSYYFSKFGPIWGWASWRRAWKYYDVNMKLWPQVKRETARGYFNTDRKEIEWRLQVFENVCRGEIDTWDYQWAFAKYMHSGLSLIPHGNLVTNIGFGAASTHTSGPNNTLALVPLKGLDFPLKPPPYICRNHAFDRMFLYDLVLKKQPILDRIRNRLIKLFNN